MTSRHDATASHWSHSVRAPAWCLRLRCSVLFLPCCILFRCRVSLVNTKVPFDSFSMYLSNAFVILSRWPTVASTVGASQGCLSTSVGIARRARPTIMDVAALRNRVTRSVQGRMPNHLLLTTLLLLCPLLSFQQNVLIVPLLLP